MSAGIETRTTFSSEIAKSLTPTNIGIGLVAYLFIYVALSWVMPFVHGDLGSAGQFGDMFGVVNAFASGLAMFGVMLAVVLQRHQIEIQAAELEGQKTAADTQLSHAATQVQVAIDQLRHVRAERLQRNKPIVFIDRWEHTEKEDNYHYVMRNVGGGFAINVYLIDRDETPLMVYPLGSLAADAERRLPDRVQQEIARQWMGSGFILVTEGPVSRTTQWTSTLNFVTTDVDARHGQVVHKLAEVPVRPPRGRHQSLEDYLANNLPSLQEQIDEFWKAESDRGKRDIEEERE